MTDSELLAAVFGGAAPPLRDACAVWIASSRPFRAFLEAHAGKIRKKARQAADSESLRDLQLELDTAYQLLAHRGVTLAYERYLADKARGPDFTVTYKGHLLFNVEVKRLRAPIADGKLGAAICDKLRQMPPSMVNILLIGADTSANDSLSVAATVKQLVLRAESKQDAFFAERGFRDSRDFLRDLQRLSGVLLRADWRDEAESALWLNPQARHHVPADVEKLLRR